MQPAVVVAAVHQCRPKRQPTRRAKRSACKSCPKRRQPNAAIAVMVLRDFTEPLTIDMFEVV